ncbi:MAG: spore maturation protein [Bacteroidetes bacterium]|uniref:Spore maturation protein n=1 Tax=Candidatus Gallipaludibacter merdavium TaxID=2840839 RepID=A0A9D9HW96_9BACT|nr:spore maturation protein [Candidatus Gallipaludibacter merdavium]
MVLNYIWIGFLVIAFLVGCIRLVAFGDTSVLPDMMNATFDSAKSGFTISLGLTGVLALWLGIMKIGEKGGAIQAFSKIVAPFFSKIFPDIPKNHPAAGSIFMNIAANMLGLDNAATPLGLKAMKELQAINPKKDEASNPMIMFLVLNTSGLTIIPIGVMVYRAQMGAANPADIFLPILIATFLSSLAGLIAVSIYQRINLFNKVIIGVLGTMCILIAGLFVGIRHLSQEQLTTYSTLISSFILLGIIVAFVLTAAFKKINVYEAFIDGAKDGFKVAVDVIPYLIAILVAVGVFRASGAMDFLIDGMAHFFAWIGINTDFVGALPTAIMKPLSGSGARGLMVDAMQQYGADSFVGRLASTIQGSTDTTFYILAVYFGSVGIKKTRYALTCGLIADLVGIVAAIIIAYIFFH